MSTHTDARTAIRQAIRDSLDASRMHEVAYAEIHASHASPAATQGADSPSPACDYSLPGEWLTDRTRSPVEHFAARLEAVGGRSIPVANPAEASNAVEHILRDAAARRIVTSNSPLVDEVVARLPEASSLNILRTPSLQEMFDADVGISSAQWAIAESGTLILESGSERNRLVSLIPPIHIVLIRPDRLRVTLGDALSGFQPVGGEMASRSITFITGPSRTADIEQMLVMGVHGPQMLYVIFIESADPS